MICWIFQTWFLKFADKDGDDVDSTRVRDDGDDYQQSNDDDEKSIGDSFSSCSVFSKCPADNLSERVVKISSPALLIIMLAMVWQYTECPRKSGVLEISTFSYTKSNPIAGVLRYRITPHQKTITNFWRQFLNPSGGQPYLGNACILGTYGTSAPPWVQAKKILAI